MADFLLRRARGGGLIPLLMPRLKKRGDYSLFSIASPFFRRQHRLTTSWKVTSTSVLAINSAPQILLYFNLCWRMTKRLSKTIKRSCCWLHEVVCKEICVTCTMDHLPIYPFRVIILQASNSMTKYDVWRFGILCWFPCFVFRVTRWT